MKVDLTNPAYRLFTTKKQKLLNAEYIIMKNDLEINNLQQLLKSQFGWNEWASIYTASRNPVTAVMKYECQNNLQLIFVMNKNTGLLQPPFIVMISV